MAPLPYDSMLSDGSWWPVAVDKTNACGIFWEITFLNGFSTRTKWSVAAYHTVHKSEIISEPTCWATSCDWLPLGCSTSEARLIIQEHYEKLDRHLQQISADTKQHSRCEPNQQTQTQRQDGEEKKKPARGDHCAGKQNKDCVTQRGRWNVTDMKL